MRHGSEVSGASQRQLRVGEELRHALSAILLRGELRDPDLHDVSITVSEVRVSPDLKHATAFVTTLNGEGMDRVLPALRRAAPYLRTLLAKAVRLRYAPQVGFQADTSFAYAHKIGALMQSDETIARDVARRADDSEDDDGA